MHEGNGGADRHGPAARAQAVGGTGVEDAASWFKVDNALSVMIGLAKVHAFILQTAVTLTGEWSDNIDDPATRNATFAEHVRARPAPLRRSAPPALAGGIGGIGPGTEPSAPHLTDSRCAALPDVRPAAAALPGLRCRCGRATWP